MSARLLSAAILCLQVMGQEGGAPVIIDGEEVVRVYGPVGTFTAQDRAPQIAQRFVALAEKGFTGTMEARAIPSEKATAVVAGPVIIMAVTDVDAEEVGIPRDELALRYAEKLQKAMQAYRVHHSWRSFLTSVLKTCIAWILFFVLAWALWKAVRWVEARLEGWFSRETARDARGIHHLIWEHGRQIVTSAMKVIFGIVLLSEFSFLVSYTLGLFPQTAGISTTLLDHLGSTFEAVGIGFVRYLPSGVLVAVAAVVTHYTLRVLKFFARAIERGEVSFKGIHPEMVKPTYQLSRLIVCLFALIVVFPYLPGGKSDAFKGVSIFVGLLLSLGSSSAVSNILAGLVLTYMRPFRAGDRVRIVDTTGDVLEKNLLVTRLRTIKNVEVVIPNGAILSNQILNFSALAHSRRLILNTTVTIGYDAPWRTVHRLLIHAALTTEGVLSEPAPFVLQTSLNDFHISYELNAYTERPNEIQDIYSNLHAAIQDSFNHAGVEIMSPTFYALRDGNTVTTPVNHRPPGYEPPAFRLKDLSEPAVTMPRPRRAGGGT